CYSHDSSSIPSAAAVISAVGDVDVCQRLFGRRQGAGVRDRNRLVDLSFSLLMDSIYVLLGEQAPVARLFGEGRERVVLAVCGRLLGGPVGDLVALEMTEVAPGLGLDQGRSISPARPSQRLTGGLVDGNHVVAVDGDAGDAVRRGAVGDARRRTVV